PTSNVSGFGGPISADDTQVQIYGDDSLGYIGAIPLPQYSIAGNSFAGHGRFVFWNKAATALYVVMQADSTAQLLSGTGVAQISPSSAIQVNVSAVVNVASQAPGRIAPGEIVSIYGTGLGPANGVQVVVDSVVGKVNTNLSGTQVFFNGIASPVLY